MYARVTVLQLRPGKIDEANCVVKDSIVPVLQKQVGFKGQLFLIEHNTDKAISVNFWETEAELTGFEANPLYRELMGKIAGILAAPPTTDRYEVGVQV